MLEQCRMIRSLFYCSCFAARKGSLNTLLQDSRVRHLYLRDILKMSAEFVPSSGSHGCVRSNCARLYWCVAALVGGDSCVGGTDLLFGTVYVSPQGRN